MPEKRLDIINETNFELNLELLEAIFEMMTEDSLFQKEDCICLKIVNDREIQSLNNKYRGKNAVTDVLTFPTDCKGIPFKGDIVINLDIAVQALPPLVRGDEEDCNNVTQASSLCKGSNTLDKEIATLFIHGLLHLAGMDHIAKKDKDKMAIYEEKYNKNVRTHLCCPTINVGTHSCCPTIKE